MGREFTTTQAARELGIDPSRVRQIARNSGKQPHELGGYLFTEEEVDAMRKRRTPGWEPGRPRKAGT